MFLFRCIACLLCFFSIAAFAIPLQFPEKTSTHTKPKEFLNAGNETGVFSLSGGTVRTTKKMTYEESVISNSWIVQLKEPPLLSYKHLAKHKLNVTFSKGQSAQKQLKLLLLNHQKKLEQQQQSFIQFALRKNLIVEVTRQMTGISNLLVVTANEKDIRQLRTFANVESINPNHRYSPLLEYSVPLIKADQVWEKKDKNDEAITGLGVRIAVLDSGIDYTHPDLGGCFGEGCKVAGGYDIYNDDNDPIEDDPSYSQQLHGTAVAGVIAASGDVKGVAPGATLYSYKVCGSDLCSESNILQGLEMAADPDQNPATDDAVDIINISLGSKYGSPIGLIPAAINRLVEAGIVVVVSAGNDAGLPSIGDIASAEKAVTVASDTDKNPSKPNVFNQHKNGIVAYSSRGPVKGADYFKPEISAPGEAIKTTGLNSNYSYVSGTSFSAPHIAGTVALLLQSNPELTPAHIKSLLVNYAIPFEDEQIAAQGGGRVDVLAAINAGLTVIPSIGFFGNFPEQQTVWNKTITLNLENISDTSKTLTLSLEDELPDGIQIILPDNSNVSLTANEGVQIEINLIVDSSVFNVSAANTFAIENALVIDTSDSVTRVPLAFSKMSEINVGYTGVFPDNLTIFNENNGFHSFSGYPQINYFVPMGTYSLVARYEDLDHTSLVFAENFNSNEIDPVDFDVSQAKNRLSITDIIDDSGVSRTNQVEGDFLYEFMHKNARLSEPSKSFSKFDLQSYSLSVSDVSSAFDFRIAGIINVLSDLDEKRAEFFSFTDKLTGITDSKDYVLDARELSSLSMDVTDQSLLQEGVTASLFTPIYGQSDIFSVLFDNNNLSGISIGVSSAKNSNLESNYYTEPFQVVVHGMSRQDTNNADLGLFTLKLATVDDNSEVLITAAQFDENKNVIAHKEYSRTPNSFSNRSIAFSFKPGDNIIYDGEGGLVRFFPSIRLNNEGKVIFQDGVFTTNIFGEFDFNTSLVDPLFSCDGVTHVIADQPQTDVTDLCLSSKIYEFQSSYESTIRDAYFHNRVSAKLLPENITEEYYYPPSIWHVYTTYEERLTTRPKNEGTKINFLTLIHDKPVTAKLEVKTTGGWEALSLVFTNFDENYDNYSATLPMPEKGVIASLRISLEDDLGNHTISTMSGAFILGEDQDTIFIDDFDADGEPDYKDLDDDNDGVEDINDNFVLDAEESLDTDLDGVGNNADIDDDADGVLDTQDAFPLDANESLDTDSDGIGNNVDSDDDGDGVEDIHDVFPLDANETIDTDNDGTGNNADADDDGDGVSDNNDAFPLDANRSAAPKVDSSSEGGGGALFFLLFLALISFCRTIRLQNMMKNGGR